VYRIAADFDPCSGFEYSMKLYIMTACISPTEMTMSTDDMYGSNPDRYAPAQESQWDELDPPELEWDEGEVSTLVDSILGSQQPDG
jgi:hypothetical protein